MTASAETTVANPFEQLPQCAANHQALTPLGFIARAALVYPDRTSVIHGARRYTWAQSYDRCRRLASALHRRGVGTGDTVAVMAANTPEIFEAHFGVPMTGAVLNTLNSRLDYIARWRLDISGETTSSIPTGDYRVEIAVGAPGESIEPQRVRADFNVYPPA